MDQTEMAFPRRHRNRRGGHGEPLHHHSAGTLEMRRSSPSEDLAPLRVLIADDYADAAKSLALVLAIAGIEAEIAMDGEQALARATEWRPHVCVLDMVMPKLDGREIARYIRAQEWGERPLLIALTGRTTAEDRLSARDAGFDHYITKPANPETLVRIIRNYRIVTAHLGHACDEP
jgi:DNA-binding response OmpR family regulator